MLDLFKLKNENKKSLSIKEKKSSKHFPSSIREWNNSIYVFNKNALRTIPSITKSSHDLIKSYLNLYNKNIERLIRTKRLLLRLRRLSSNKIYVSNGEFKHTNSKVLITLYLFNRQKHNYMLILKKSYFKAFNRYKKKLKKRLKLIKNKSFNYLKKINKNIPIILQILNKRNNVKNTQINNFKYLYLYINRFYTKLGIKTMRKLKLYIYYKQLLLINKTKFNYIYLVHLKKYLEKLYNKNLEINLVNIKRFYLNSDILAESLTVKLTRNRRKILRYLNNLKKKVKIRKRAYLSKPVLNNLILKKKLNNNNKLKYFVFKKLKYKNITGFRLETKGRLTKRYTASRSVFKIKHKGNLLNRDSSFKGLSSVLLKGNLRSNVQYSKLNSKTRIGSFGIKGWVSGD